MAQVIQKIRSARDKYPWLIWADGKARRLTRGVDFHCDFDAFRSAVAWYAKSRGIKGSVAKSSENTVDVQFILNGRKSVGRKHKASR